MDMVMNMNYDKLTIDKENDIVKYNDELHKYWTKITKEPCISVTTLINKFTTFDEVFWSRYKALQRLIGEDEFDGPIIGKSVKRGPASDAKKALLDSKKYDHQWSKYYNLTEEAVENMSQIIRNEWNEKRETSCIRGTAIHRQHELEHLAGNTKELSHLKLEGKFKPVLNNILEPGQGVYPELLLSRISPDNKLRLAGQADLVIVDGFDVWILDYKGLSLDTPIATTFGYKLLKDLTKEDIIFDKNGNTTRIKNISEIHYNPCYQITFDNGETIIADHEHRWLISFFKSKGNYKEVVMTTEQLKHHLENITKRTSYNIPKIINALPLNLPEINLPIDPYILGAWLGDGTSKDGSITNIDQRFWDEIQRRGYEVGKNISSENRAEVRTIKKLRRPLNALNLLKNKHIPELYLRASYKQRLDLLRGFMDTDGYYNKTRKRYVMATTKKWQADDLCKLLASLGVKPTIINAKKYCGDKIFGGYDVCFTFNENPFLIRNQENIEYPKTDQASFRNIISVEITETIPTKCLEVDNDSHTFLAGYMLIPTHNTGKTMEMKAYYDRKKRSTTNMFYPLNNIQDTNYWHYSLQLSTYAWIIEQLNPDFQIKGLILIHEDHDGGITTYECDYLKLDVVRMLAYYKKQLEHDEFKRAREKVIF